jgi:hypothetical protein
MVTGVSCSAMPFALSHAVRNTQAELDALSAELRALPGPVTVGLDVDGSIAAFLQAVLLADSLALVHVPGLAVNRAAHGYAGGDRDLKRILYQSAFRAFSSHPESRAYYDRKRREGKHHVQAVIALARQRTNVLWALIATDTAYNPNHRAA